MSDHPPTPVEHRGPASPQSAGPTVRQLAWIDPFFRKIREHVFVRGEDGVLILPPNQVYRLNEGALRIIRHVLSGKRIARLPGLTDGERALQVSDFFTDLKGFYQGDSTSLDSRRSVDRIPFSFDYTRLPVLGEIAVTYRCNNACRFCYAECGTRRQAEPEMTLLEVERVIRVFKEEARIPFFSFTGGEPLVREDLERMIRFGRRSGLEVNLVTNGTLADRARARSLAKAGLRTAQVSLEAPDKDMHEALTATPGSFERTLTGIRSLKAAGISVQTNTTITAENARVVPRMPAFLKSLGISRFAMNLYIPDPRSRHSPALHLRYGSIGEIVEAVRREARAEGLVFYWYSPTPHCLYNPIARGLGNKSCAAMDGLVSVSPSGDILPCSSYPEPMGNLLRQDFRAIWFSERAMHFKHKKYAPEECTGCEGFTACQAACPLYWRYAGTGEIRNTCAGASRVRASEGPASGARAPDPQTAHREAEALAVSRHCEGSTREGSTWR